jgi:predicted regulator of Ras-like GTPase activity (Roadblock/LC7/MglB family)
MLGSLCESWPDGLKNEILSSPLAHANIPLDGAVILPGLRRGRVVMQWGHIRQLAQPNSEPSQYDNLELELPLKVIAPLFLASHKAPTQRPRVRGMTTEIPDLFFGFPQPAQAPAIPAAPIAPVAPPLASAAPAAPAAPLAPAVPVVPPLPKPANRSEDTNFYVWGENGEVPQNDEAGLKRNEVPQTDFLSRQSHPKDVVARAMALPGVAGAVVAMADGMRVASQVPVELSADTVAAFLPQIFDRVNQSTRELRMGPLNNVKFTVGNVPWKIFRVNAVYFAAFGRAGEQLPSAQLAQLASEMDRKK